MEEFKSIYQDLSDERKHLQGIGQLPDWINTPSYQLLKDKYLLAGETLQQRFEDIAVAAASHLPTESLRETYRGRFYELLWSGHLSCSTPVLSSMGRKEYMGCPVACSGQEVEDSIFSFYNSQTEAAMLTKEGFGTAVYLGDIRPRGSKITNSRGTASGILPVLKDFTQVATDVAQSNRRGAIACYIPIDHPDYFEIVNYVSKNPDGVNIGWVVSDDFIGFLESGDQDANLRYCAFLKLKMLTGKGYIFKKDAVNRQNPIWYKDKGIEVKTSNLCNEITLPTSDTETFTCVLSAMNLAKYEEWHDTDAIFDSTIFLHCVALEFLKVSEGIKGLEKAREFTKNHMALGLGVLGFHTLLQNLELSFGSLQAHTLNINIFSSLNEETHRASKYLAQLFGECPMTEGYGVANAHLTAISPTLSTAVIMGGVSNGIEPLYSNAYMQGTAAGKITRVNPYVLRIAKEKGIPTEVLTKELMNNNGSTQDLDWLTDEQKAVTKTAFEINQEYILRLAITRQKYITQGQSLNLFFSADESEEEISRIHQLALRSPILKGLYYIRSTTGIKAKDRETACEACAS